MKSTDNRYRPPRVQYNIDKWARRKPLPDKGHTPVWQEDKVIKKEKRKP